MKIISSGSYKGVGKYNNDIINNIDNFYYVMDGATSLFNDNIFSNKSDLYEYMQSLKRNISNCDNIVNSIKNGIIKTNKDIYNIMDIEEYILPTFTIAAVKEYSNYIEFYLLCDCLISILYKDGLIENVWDDRYTLFKKKYKKNLQDIDNLNLNVFETFKLKRPIWEEMRKFANKDNGYPVGSTRETSIDKGIIKKINKDKIDKILICSDGLYSEFGIPLDKNYFEKDILEVKISKTDNKDDLSYYLLKC